MNIRFAKEADLQTVDRLYNLCRQEFNFPDKSIQSSAFILETILAKHTDFLVCFDDNDVAIGYISISQTISTAIMGKAMLLIDFYIHEKFRSKGIGSKMLDFLEKYLTDNKYTCMFLVTMPHLDKTRDFYLKNGWGKEDLVFFRKLIKENIT